MRTRWLLVSLTCAALLPTALACGGGDDSQFKGGASSGASSSGSSSGDFGGSGGASSSSGGGQRVQITDMRIEPANATLTVQAGASITQSYKVFGKLNGGSETDITDRAVFYVPDNVLVGTFPTNGAATFTSRLPAMASDPPQRGGKVTVRARVANSDGTIPEVDTSLTIRLEAPSLTGAGTVPANAASLFSGAPAAERKPLLAYPNDGTMLPPNLRRLEVHWRPGNNANTLYELSFQGAGSLVRYFTRCNTTVANGSVRNGACVYELDERGYRYLADSNAGLGPVKLQIRATDDAGSAHGASDIFNIEFAQESVNGGVYYWDSSNTRIMRFDFGAAGGDPEVFLAQGDYGTPNTCIGCHTLSRDGKKIVASIGGQWDGRLIYQNDLTRVPAGAGRTDPNYLTKKGDPNNRVQFASFNPTASQFVAVNGDVDGVERNYLWFHDGTTGERASHKALAFEPDHPDWAPNGNAIAVTRVGIHYSSQRPRKSGIELLTFNGANLGDPVTLVPIADGKNRFNPNFTPDSSLLYFTEVTCAPGTEDSDQCDGDVDHNLNARTWAMRAQAGATPIDLANARKPGVGDAANSETIDTFPRSTPFQTKQGTGKLFWFTVASRRMPGLRNKGNSQQLLWMFAIDPAKVAAGMDGSYTGFFMPMQDMTTSNHIAQWTERVVGSSQPPPPPPPPAVDPPTPLPK